MQMGGAYLVMWTVLCFQFHTHQPLKHSKASHYFQTVAELNLSLHAPESPAPLPKLTRVCMRKFSLPPMGTEALTL